MLNAVVNRSLFSFAYRRLPDRENHQKPEQDTLSPVWTRKEASWNDAIGAAENRKPHKKVVSEIYLKGRVVSQ